MDCYNTCFILFSNIFRGSFLSPNVFTLKLYIVAISNLIKRMAIDHLHIVGDIYDSRKNSTRFEGLDGIFD